VLNSHRSPAAVEWLTELSKREIAQGAIAGAIGTVLGSVATALLLRAPNFLGFGLFASILGGLVIVVGSVVALSRGGHRDILFSSGKYEGVKWKWRWKGDQVDRSRMTPYCGKCGEEIEGERVPSDVFINRISDRYDFKCGNDDCDFSVQTSNSKYDIANRIEIDWESGEWWKWWKNGDESS